VTPDVGVAPETSVQAMLDADNASRAMGMRILAVASGRVDVEMTVDASMVNGHGICHGGMIFSLADSAAAFAAGTRNVRSVAASCDIAFLRAANLGERLLAEACERSSVGRTSVYDVTVSHAGQTVAEMRAVYRSLRRPIVPAASGG